MEISAEKQGNSLICHLKGRFDAFGSRGFLEEVEPKLKEDVLCVILDMGHVDYISSAALRTILVLFKRMSVLNGTLAIVNLQPYCQRVLDMAGFASSFPVFDAMEKALSFCSDQVQESINLKRWSELEQTQLDCGFVRIIPGGEGRGVVEVLGHVKDVLYSQITTADLCSKRFSETEYSIGLGGLGDGIDDYFGIMGEMITIGGTMVWLPTDGHDIPDFLIPKIDTGEVTIRTAFNVSISGGFNEFFMFDSREEDGTTMSRLYREIFNLSRKRRPDYRGVIGIALRAQMASVYGSGIKHSPIKESAPANGEMVVHPDNLPDWFEIDKEPHHRDVTCLICGIGADLSMDLSSYDDHELNSVFYLHPANVGEKTELLHNHAVVFSEIPMPEKMVNLDKEIRSVVDKGEFIDMRHLLDTSAIRRAFIGVTYIQEFRRDPHGRPGH